MIQEASINTKEVHQKAMAFSQEAFMVSLSGNPPDDIATELRLLFDDIKKQYLPKKSSQKSSQKSLKKIVLLTGIPELGLAAGDVGTVIYTYEKGSTLKVEFVSLDGAIVAIETLSAQQVRSVGKQDMIHSRHLNFL